MRYKKYLSALFLGLILLPAFSAKKAKLPVAELDLKSVRFIELDTSIELGFDTQNYLPEDFNPYKGEISVEHINYIEEDVIELDFDTQEYLPSNFNAFK